MTATTPHPDDRKVPAGTLRGPARGKLDPDRLYLGDNGRCFCGSNRCAGASAYYSGRDLSGQKVYPVTAEDAATVAADTGHALACETCGRTL